VIVPLRRAGEAQLVEGIEVFGIASITQLVAFLRGEPMPLVEPVEVMGEQAGKHASRRLDIADVVGQVEAKWACEVAAAGRHHMLFHGPPGVGKAMLAERVPGLLPDLDVHDALEVSAVHSLAGSNLADELISRPPYSDPHHSASVASIVGGGQRMAKPGAISCAHAKVSLCSMGTSAGLTKLALSEVQVTADSSISVQLIKNDHPGARPVVVIIWPLHVTECSPAKLGDVISNACRILGNASIELAAAACSPPAMVMIRRSVCTVSRVVARMRWAVE
jgi:DNA polymerase III delta prime subunit